MAANFYKQIRKTHAVVPKLEHFVAKAGQFRINKNHRLIDVHINRKSETQQRVHPADKFIGAQRILSYKNNIYWFICSLVIAPYHCQLLFTLQTPYRVGQRSFNTLETYRKQGYDDRRGPG